MRVSTSILFDRGVQQMNRQQAAFAKVGEQLASGRRVVNPSDDPQAAARAVGISQSLAEAEQYSEARTSARNSLAQQESVLGGVTDYITRARVLVTQASNETLTDIDRQTIASELKGLYETLVGQANATNGNGQYLFGGYQDRSEPFVRAPDGSTSYVGDNFRREERIDSSRLLPVSENGNTVFRSVQSSAGYVAEADEANTGAMEFRGPSVVNAADPNFGDTFDLDFIVDGAGTRFTINGGPEIPYSDGGPIEFGGLSITLSGQPADGDALTLGPATDMNTDLFVTLEKTIAALETNTTLPQDAAAVSNRLKTSMRELSNSLDNVLVVRAQLGARLNELDAVDAVSAQNVVNLEANRSGLVDLDFVDAISEYSLRQVGLQAAQRAFADISKLSLFNSI